MTKKMKAPINALLEIGTEEIPARFMDALLEDLKLKAQEKLAAEKIKCDAVQTLGTARRLVLYISGIMPKQPDIAEEVKGPPKEFAFDAQGKPTKAAEGFARSQGVNIDNLFMRDVDGKGYIYAKIIKKGRRAEDILKDVFPQIIKSLYLPIYMHWGEQEEGFIRPVHWMVAICGNKTVPFEFAGIKASKITYSHRFLGNKPFTISVDTGINLEKYKRFLIQKGVILDQNQRRQIIRTQAQILGQKYGSTLIEKDLLDEVTYLVENPSSLVGRFNADLLSIPAVVLVTSMKKNLKYFPIVDFKKNLTANYVVVTDGVAQKYFTGLRDGNQRVLEARLNDAAFFFNEDRKIPLAKRVGDLTRISFYGGLGTLADKKDRIKSLAKKIAESLAVSNEEMLDIEKVSELCKADLSTQMVFEFTDLQGVIGREYALLSGEKESVAEGIFEHYLPRFAGDKLPQTIAGTVVALADKIDTLVGCFSIGMVPSGSADPYALRRQALGVLMITLNRKLNYSLSDIIKFSYSLYRDTLQEYKASHDKAKGLSFESIKKELIGFISSRARNYLLDEGIPYDVADACLAVFDNMLNVVDKARVMAKEIKEEWFKGVVMTADRIARIAEAVLDSNIKPDEFADPIEKELYALYQKVSAVVEEKAGKGHWEIAIKELARLTKPIEEYFVEVMVMHEDARIKRNRLAQLKSLLNTYLMVADFQKIVV